MAVFSIVSCKSNNAIDIASDMASDMASDIAFDIASSVPHLWPSVIDWLQVNCG